MRRFQWVCALIVFAGVAASSQAVVVDLTNAIGDSGTINGAIYQVDDPNGPAGTGVLNSFVRINPGGNVSVEQGYNTSGRPVPFDENNSPNFTRNLQISNLVTKLVGVTPYYQFLLDINERDNNGESFLSLDTVEIFTSPTGSQTTTNVASLGTLRYDMDAGTDSTVLLDQLLIGSGSGRADMTLLVPTSLFAGALSTDFVYLYSHFGSYPQTDSRVWGASAGFEEWALGASSTLPPDNIPEPLTMLLVGMGIAAVGARARKRLA